MRFAHISDLHFACPNLHPSQILSKRWLGNLNFYFKRRHQFDYIERLPALQTLFKEAGVTHVAISGDLSVTSHKEEFEKAATFVYEIGRMGYPVYVVPGNHDHYTASADKQKLFYHYFPTQYDDRCKWNLRDHRVTSVEIQPHHWLVLLDTAVPTSLLSSQGLFDEKLEKNLEEVLHSIPTSDTILLMNHFPFFQNDKAEYQMIRAQRLRKCIEHHPNIVLYLHGHTHRQIVADLRLNRLPILSDPGSVLEMSNGACHLIDIQQTVTQISVYRWEQRWTLRHTHDFALTAQLPKN